MKKFIFPIITLLMLCGVECSAQNRLENEGKNIAGGHEYVDLGLPSGTKWATCNVGATKPEEYGAYYAWGETKAKDVYDVATYKYITFNKKKSTEAGNRKVRSIGMEYVFL